MVDFPLPCLISGWQFHAAAREQGGQGKRQTDPIVSGDQASPCCCDAAWACQKRGTRSPSGEIQHAFCVEEFPFPIRRTVEVQYTAQFRGAREISHREGPIRENHHF